MQPDLFAAQMMPGDRILLASDGLMKHLDDPEIGRIVPKLHRHCTGLLNPDRSRKVVRRAGQRYLPVSRSVEPHPHSATPCAGTCFHGLSTRMDFDTPDGSVT